MRYPDALTTPQTADLLDCPPSRVYALARSGMIHGSKHHGRWYFDTESVLHYGIRGRSLPPRLWRVTPAGGPARTYATPHTARMRVIDLFTAHVPATIHRATIAWDTHIDPVTGYQIPRGHSEYRVHQRVRPPTVYTYTHMIQRR